MNRRRLADVLRVRRLQERAERARLAASNREHRAAIDAEAAVWSGLEAGGVELARRGAFVALAETRSAGLLAAERRRGATEEAAAGVAIARAGWASAARRVEGLERLDERLAEVEDVEAERVERVELDDLVLARRGVTLSGDETAGRSLPGTDGRRVP